MLQYATFAPGEVLRAVEDAATFHDLGKLDTDIQSALAGGRGTKLAWDHIDAGVAHLSGARQWMAAWLVRAHHAPGFPENQEHFNPDNLGRRLRGRRRDDLPAEIHDEQVRRTDQFLGEYLQKHESVVGSRLLSGERPTHGLTMRLALSCLVDADHSDAAFFDTRTELPDSPGPRWNERLESLCNYVRGLAVGRTEAERTRNRQRAAFFEACLNSDVAAPIVACEGPVGLGKTTAVAAYLIRRALVHDPPLRRLIIVAPFTNVLKQIADRLRKALVLPGEDPDHTVMEHHHRADFEHQSDRDLAALWRSPVVVTTAVSFFETLAACEPASLRKLHAVPGSAIFLDEAHAALPAKLWPQNWRWVTDLTTQWGCQVVLASGSLGRFWEDDQIISPSVGLPKLPEPSALDDSLRGERRRVRYQQLAGGLVLAVGDLIASISREPGPRLVILNTVQNAAVVASALRAAGQDTVHISTALTPTDRDVCLVDVAGRLSSEHTDWTLVATSCLEAGVDLSFRCAFRERFAAASTIQVGGRVNRNDEFFYEGGGVVFDFALADEGITQHPAARVSADVLFRLFAENRLNGRDPSDVVTEAMRNELAIRGGLGADPLRRAEQARNYPAVASAGRVIDADTRLVVIANDLRARLTQGVHVGLLDLLRGSVQLWATRIEKLGLVRLPGRRDVYAWDGLYDGKFLGYMAGVLQNQEFLKAGGQVI